MPGAAELIHATCIAVAGRAALLLGASGSGKSDLALRALATEAGLQGRRIAADLVADDQVLLELDAGRLVARAPATLAGRIEVRGLGIIEMAHVERAEVRLAVELVHGQAIERLPDPIPEMVLLGQRLPLLRLRPFEASAPLKLLLALARL